VVEIAEELIEAVPRRHVLVAVAEMFLASPRGNAHAPPHSGACYSRSARVADLEAP
jgi:hypothetical protein